VGISYDSLAVLPRAQAKHHITFPLLSDEGSRTIDAYGVRNREAEGRAKGIPHPATFLVDKQGVIRAKLFYEGYTKRHTSLELIQAAKALRQTPFIPIVSEPRHRPARSRNKIHWVMECSGGTASSYGVTVTRL
jgi:alkyl hydroperoxide reductase subunit AhpC